MSKRHHPSWKDSKVLSSWPRVSCWLLSRFSRHLPIILCLCETSEAAATPRRGTLISDADQQRVRTTVEHYGIFQSEGTSVSVSGSALMIVPGRRLVTFDPMNAHSQAAEPPLCFVMEFNAAEREWQERLNRMLEDLENRLRMESPSRAATKEQRHASQDPDTLTG